MSTAIDGEDDFVERRTFPRLPANCPVLYRVKENQRWLVATLDEYSATGFSMVCDDNLKEGSEIAILAAVRPSLSCQPWVRCCAVRKTISNVLKFPAKS